MEIDIAVISATVSYVSWMLFCIGHALQNKSHYNKIHSLYISNALTKDVSWFINLYALCKPTN